MWRAIFPWNYGTCYDDKVINAQKAYESSGRRWHWLSFMRSVWRLIHGSTKRCHHYVCKCAVYEYHTDRFCTHPSTVNVQITWSSVAVILFKIHRYVCSSLSHASRMSRGRGWAEGFMLLSHHSHPPYSSWCYLPSDYHLFLSLTLDSHMITC